LPNLENEGKLVVKCVTVRPVRPPERYRKVVDVERRKLGKI